MRNYVVVIPAYQPMDTFHHYVNELLQEEVAQVIIVDDGNEERYDNLFEQLKQSPNCIVLHHERNHGKGAALKTAFGHYLEHFSHLAGVVTADADGQHLIKDVLEVGDRLQSMDHGFILGTRVFDRKEMPTRSFIGNTITSRIFQVLFGKYIGDTQTGLRGITKAELDEVLQLRGSHFDFEMNMLIFMINSKKRVVRVDIEAVYAEEHTSTYHTYADSVKIAGLIAKAYLNQSLTE